MAGTLLNGSTFNKTNANDQLNATLNQDGLLMRMAKTKGQQAAGGRGLMNSSIGSEASMRAMVDAAVPVAQQNTQFEQTKDVNQQQSDLTAKRDSTLQGYQQANMGLESDLTAKRDSTLQGYTKENAATQQGYNVSNMALQQGYTQDNARLNADLTGQRDKTLFGYDQQSKATDFENQLKTMSEQQRNDLAKLNAQTTASKDLAAQQQQFTLTNTAKQVAANTQGMYLEAINGLTSTFGDQVAQIQSSAMKAADKTNAINSLINSQNAMLKFYQSTYQNMSTIKDDWINVDVQTLPSGTIANVR